MVKKNELNAKVSEIESKIPDVSSLVKKTDHATEITNIKNDYVTNAALNARHQDLIQKTKFDAEVKKINDKIASNSSEVLTYDNRLNQSKHIIDDLERYASYFRGKNYFDGNDGAQNSLVFQVGEKYFKNNSGSNSSKIEIWKSKGLSIQSLDLSGTVGTANDKKMNKPITPAYVIFNHKESFFEQKKENIIKSGSIVNIYIVYSLSQKTINSDNVFKKCLFGATRVTKPGDTTDSDKYIYSGCDLGFDRTSQFTHPQGRMAKNIIIFRVNSSNSVHATNKTQNILTLGHGLTQKVDNTTIYAEKMYSPDFSAENKIFCLSLHYNGNNSYLFVNGKEVTKIKAKKSEIKGNQLTLGSISTSDNLSVSNIEDSILYGNFMTLVLTIALFQMTKHMIFMLI